MQEQGEWRIYPDYGIGVVSFSNERYGAPSFANAMTLDTLVSLAKLQPRKLVPSEILQKRKDEIISFLSSPTEDSSLFAENFFLDQSLKSRMAEIDPLLKEAGKIQNIQPLIPFNQLRGEFILVGENRNVHVFFTLTPEKNPLVQQLDVWSTEK